jgi:hypothetical protein
MVDVASAILKYPQNRKGRWSILTLVAANIFKIKTGCC